MAELLGVAGEFVEAAGLHNAGRQQATELFHPGGRHGRADLPEKPFAIDDPGGMIGREMHPWGSIMAAIERAGDIIMDFEPAEGVP
ncbi:bifunctional DNA primase/polymerase [Aliidongia dinghuensis]|nr:hypothetical protein [Aliidongia dinghuensis]